MRLASHIEPTVDVTVTAIDASGLSFTKTFTITVKAPQIITPVSPPVPPDDPSSDGDNATAADSGGKTAKDQDSGSKSSTGGEAGKQAAVGTVVAKCFKRPAWRPSRHC